MARLRNEDRIGLPQNLYINSAGYYWYRDSQTRKTRGLGRDREAAIRYAQGMNESMGIRADGPKGIGYVGELLEAEYLADFAKPVRKICGVYVLMQDREIVYVGQSVNCHSRIGNHLNDAQKVFDSYFIVECKECHLEELESSYILKFRPKYNVQIPKVRNEIARFMALAASL